MKLTYNNSKIYPDRSCFPIVKWEAQMEHVGLVQGGIVFRVTTIGDSREGTKESILEQIDEYKDWQEIARFNETMLWCEFAITDKEYAGKYSYYHSLHACHQLAEDIAVKMLNELMVGI